ncbi:hypothetical protein SAMN04487895_108224 [Paenibacillus sophorae]|uniref:Uncharacterized protein n=1 Tax=Paenibacillus sophorae TaxID=1333845 RepID=A0A1H8QHC3_9BACL|nr:hypothetical protein [Paenibacillus sophorae]QWU15130.1 hypothetical protein KP014_25090 [Paenibacillus sophorae]SEO53317.1 hypothetical protein SAMN04487895_108224 [Paenibacillus sophorae]
MFNKRWKRVMAWILSVIIVLVVGGAFAANYAVDKLMSSMAGGLEVQNTEDSGELESSAVPNSQTVADNSIVADSENVKPQGTTSKTGVNAVSKTAVNEQQPSSSVSPKPESLTDYTPQVSADKVSKINENVSIKDKTDVISIVMGELSITDVKRLQELAQGGLTLDEKKKAKDIIIGKVTEKQYNELSQIAKKYGLSEGKSYSQILAEEKGSK